MGLIALKDETKFANLRGYADSGGQAGGDEFWRKAYPATPKDLTRMGTPGAANNWYIVRADPVEVSDERAWLADFNLLI